jgi:HEAT repeat protein
MRWIPITFILLGWMSLVAEPSMSKNHILFLVHQGKVEQAIDNYKKLCRDEGKADFKILEQMALQLMSQGAHSPDKEAKLLAFYGAGLAMNHASIDLLKEGLISNDPTMQSICLYFLAQMNDDTSDELILKALSSDFLGVRMEACYLLALKKHTKAMGQIVALMQKLPPFFRPFFPSLFASLGTHEAIRQAKTFLHDPNVHVRIETIAALGRTHRDDFSQEFSQRLSHASVGEQEALLDALAKFQDSSSLALMQRYSLSTVDSVRLAALKGLYKLGNKESKTLLEKSALNKDPFAVFALSEIDGSAQVLFSLLFSEDMTVRINAAIALLQRRDPRCLSVLLEMLLQDSLYIQPVLSLGRAHLSFRLASPSIGRNKEEKKALTEMFLQIKEQLLSESVQLGEEAFLEIAKQLFARNKLRLIPSTIHLLENIRSDNITSFLEEQTRKVGSPLIRNYAHLALFRMGKEGDHENYLLDWMKENQSRKMIELRPHLSLNERMQMDQYSLSAEETSRLLMEIFTAFAQKRDLKSILTVLDAIKEGHPHNRSALAGLLLRAIE